MFQKGKKAVLHNGLMDLMFLYTSFFAPLPPTLEEFADTLFRLFGTIIDTKYLFMVMKSENNTSLHNLYLSVYEEILN